MNMQMMTSATFLPTVQPGRTAQIVARALPLLLLLRTILVNTQMMENATFLPTATPGRTAQTVAHVEVVAAAA